MTITFTTPRMFGYRLFFETFNYTATDKLFDCDKDEYNTNIWLLGKFHLVISNERVAVSRVKEDC